jgi:hypothetical protein
LQWAWLHGLLPGGRVVTKAGWLETVMDALTNKPAHPDYDRVKAGLGKLTARELAALENLLATGHDRAPIWPWKKAKDDRVVVPAPRGWKCGATKETGRACLSSAATVVLTSNGPVLARCRRHAQDFAGLHLQTAESR